MCIRCLCETSRYSGRSTDAGGTLPHAVSLGVVFHHGRRITTFGMLMGLNICSRSGMIHKK